MVRAGKRTASRALAIAPTHQNQRDFSAALRRAAASATDAQGGAIKGGGAELPTMTGSSVRTADKRCRYFGGAHLLRSPHKPVDTGYWAMDQDAQQEGLVQYFDDGFLGTC